MKRWAILVSLLISACGPTARHPRITPAFIYAEVPTGSGRYVVLTNDVGPTDHSTLDLVMDEVGCAPCAVQWSGTGWVIQKPTP